MDFRLQFVTARQRAMLIRAAIAAALLVLAAVAYLRPPLPLPGRTSPVVGTQQPVHTTVDIGGGRTVVVVTRVRAPGFVGPIVIDQDHWLVVGPAERPAPRSGRRLHRM